MANPTLFRLHSRESPSTIAPKLLNGWKICKLTKLLNPFLTHTLVYSFKWPLPCCKTFNYLPVSLFQLSLCFIFTIPLLLSNYSAPLLKASATEVLVCWYSFYRRLSGPQGQSGHEQMKKNFHPSATQY